jgi:hypothetical protein
MIQLFKEFLSLAGIVIFTTLGIELIGRAYINRKLNIQTKIVIYIATILCYIALMDFCIKSYLLYKF